MFHRFDGTVQFAVYSMLAVLLWQPVAAEQHNYNGTLTLCISTCDSFAALGGPGGSANVQPSDVTGSLQIPNSGPNQSFSFAESANIQFAFEIVNTSAPMEAAMFDGMGNFLNPTSANPLPLSPAVARIAINNGTTNANGVLNGGQIVVRFTAPPFSSNGAHVYFNLANGSAQGFLFTNAVLFTEIAGSFSVPPGTIQLTGAPVAFANTAVGQTSSAPVTVTNTGAGNLTIQSVATVNPLAPPFAIGMNGCTGQVLAPQGTCMLRVDFSPTMGMIEAFSDSFSIVSSDPVTPTRTVNVSGIGLEPNLQATPVPLSFVATSVGETSQAVTTVRNTGTANLIIGMIDFSVLDPQFSVAIDNCSMMTLTPNSTCTLTMEFSPQGEGLFTTGFIFPSNDTDLPLFNYGLEGEGIFGTIATITVNPGLLTFDEILVGETAERTIQVNSTGNDPLTLNSFALSGPNAAEFGDSDFSACPGVLPSGQNCTVTVIFTPVSGGAKSATLTVDSNGSLRPILDIPLTASAFEGPRIAVSSTTLDLGSPSAPIDVGGSTTADLTISNTGTSDLAIGTLNIVDLVRGGVTSTEFTVASNGCATPVAPLGSCIITVGFAPLTDADKTAHLFIPSDDVANPNTIIDLIGYVFRGARVDVPRTSVDVGGGASVEIGQSAVFNLNIGNSGTLDLEISGFALGGANANVFSFDAASNCIGTPILPLGSCVVAITFTPMSTGEKTAELSIFSNDVTLVRAATIVVPLSGTATAPVVVPPLPPGSQTVQPPSFARADPGGGALGVGLLGLGLILLIARRRYR